MKGLLVHLLRLLIDGSCFLLTNDFALHGDLLFFKEKDAKELFPRCHGPDYIGK